MGGRGMIRLKYVHAFRDRMGRMRYYFRRHGIWTVLPGLPGSNQFMAAYGALLSVPSKTVEPRAKAAKGTFAALAIRYYGSPQYHSLSATSRANYRRVIDGFLEEHGHRQVKEMTREHVDIIIGKMANKPGAGIILLKRVRTLVRYALALGWINRDPTAGADPTDQKKSTHGMRRKSKHLRSAGLRVPVSALHLHCCSTPDSADLTSIGCCGRTTPAARFAWPSKKLLPN